MINRRGGFLFEYLKPDRFHPGVVSYAVIRFSRKQIGPVCSTLVKNGDYLLVIIENEDI